MNNRHIGIFGVAALGLVLAAPVHAGRDFEQGRFYVAERARDRGEAVRHERPEPRPAERRSQRREAEREEPHGYGYGYERRQRHDREDDMRPPRERR